MAAICLGRRGLDVTLCDPKPREDLSAKSRAYALTHSSRRLLERLSLWEDLQKDLIPFRQLRLEDRRLCCTAWFNVDDLPSHNRYSDAIGWILDHKALMACLFRRLVAEPSLQLQLGHGFDAYPPFSTDSLETIVNIAADGSQSQLRHYWQLPFLQHQYRQGCLTTKVLLRGCPSDTAHELFRDEGPLAVLPLGDAAFQIVWTAPLERCRDLAAMNSAHLLDELAAALPNSLEPERLLDCPGVFPLELNLAPRLHNGISLLVGESGHRCHPVGGQGLNLCWRDVAELDYLFASVTCGSLPLRHLGRAYSLRRLPDLVMVGLTTDLLVRLFSSKKLLPKIVRTVPMQLLRERFWARRLALQGMSDGPLTLGNFLPESIGLTSATLNGHQQPSTTNNIPAVAKIPAASQPQ